MTTPYDVTYDLNEYNQTVIITEKYPRYDSQLEIVANCKYIFNGEFSEKRIVDFSYRGIRYPGDTLANWQGRENNRFATIESIQTAENKLKQWVESGMVEFMRNAYTTPCYQAMAEKASVKDLPAHYREDFTFHDLLSIAKINPPRFVWILRNAGTWLITGKSEFASAIFDHCQKNPERQFYFIWNGSELTECTPHTAREFYMTGL